MCVSIFFSFQDFFIKNYIYNYVIWIIDVINYTNKNSVQEKYNFWK